MQPQCNDTQKVLKWKSVERDASILTLWPGCTVNEDDVTFVHDFFRDTFDIDIVIVGCVFTLPCKDNYGYDIKDTGGRCDFFFYVDAVDIPKFALRRFKYGMSWWEDVYFNHNEYIYPLDFRTVYPEPI